MERAYEYKRSPITRRIFIAMLAPTILMNLTTAIGSMADTMIIGHYLDDLSLSVVTFATPIYMIINTFAALFAVGGCIAMSIDAGKGEKDTANQAFSLSMELLALIGGLLLLAGVLFSGTIADWLGAGDDVFDMVRVYSQIILIGAPIFTLNIGVAFFVRNDGRPTLSMVGMFLSIIVDIILNVVFVGYMDMGVAGAAYSTVIGQLVSVLVIGSHFLSKKNTLKFRFTCNSLVWRIFKNGGSAALHFVYQFLTILIINHFLATLAGTNGVVIYTVVFNLSTVSLSVFEGISQTIQPMISNFYGEKSLRNIKTTLWLALIAVLIICGSVTALLELFPQAVPIAFGLDDAVLISQSAQAVRIFAVSMIITTINVVIGYYLQSTEQNMTAAVLISLRCFILFLGATLLLGKFFGMNGVWAAYAVAEILSFAICLVMLRVKQTRLHKHGTNADLLLLDRDAAAGITTVTYRATDRFDEYREAVVAALADMDEAMRADAAAYLSVLADHSLHSKRTLVETEIHRSEQKIIIRDNLNHTTLEERIPTALSHNSKTDYGPVLGWNRICLEAGEPT